MAIMQKRVNPGQNHMSGHIARGCVHAQRRDLNDMSGSLQTASRDSR
jgi:hypothetical protein